ncbi:flagellar brake protein [Cupriavidus sp. D39]|uniref:flagellar brake protein n=1 Tax=Cupriavidus sp. D39 TaxID=2997877 RepID=UPI003B63AF86
MSLKNPNAKRQPNSTQAPSDGPLDDRHRLTRPMQISAVLLDLAWLKCVVRLSARDSYKIATTLLKVDPVSCTFIFDGCRTDAERDLLLTSDQIAVSAVLRDVRIDFVIGRPSLIKYQGGPACAATFPSQLYHFERRRQPRARPHAAMGYRSELHTPDDHLLTLDIADLSLSGVGLRSKGMCTDRLPMGTILQKCRLDFRNQGELEFDLQVVGHGLAWEGQRAMHHIGCTFVALAPGQQTFLQRLVYHIELAGRE